MQTAKRAFEGDLTLSTLALATKGLASFAVPCMTINQVDAHNEYKQALSMATATTMANFMQNVSFPCFCVQMLHHPFMSERFIRTSFSFS